MNCRLVVRNKQGPAEVLEFIAEGLEAGQQVFALGGPAYLKDIAHNLGESGLRVETLLRNGRLGMVDRFTIYVSSRKNSRNR